ncbi:response regulator [Cohnella zeiphila]|uniref:Response regulator n=1 Tax=Cohnella zeiphila TaxID=2761120 RepID=A0A7X0VYI5_9BACL|nr:response regulator [Cohnella zeiphila]MBB6734512.1 response regulator [Cohnella zeiphila]
MYRILLVDNESYIVDGLAEMVEEERRELEVYKAYSASEAVDWLNRTRIDLMLTDIRMPGMSGLELQRLVVRQWPRCKILFLSGYNDFAYVQEAMRYGGVDYLLKTDGDEKILEAIDRAVQSLEDQLQANEILQRAQAQVRDTLPLLRKDFFCDLLHGDLQALRSLSGQFQMLDAGLDSAQQLLLVVGRTDRPAHIPSTDWPLLLFAVQNIAEEYMATSVRSLSIPFDSSRIVWFVQLPDGASETEEWERAARFIGGTLERIQETCLQLLELKISFVFESECGAWQQVPERFGALCRHMNRSLVNGLDMQLLRISPESEAASSSPSIIGRPTVPGYKLEMLATCLETGQKSQFLAVLHEMAGAASLQDPDPLEQVSLYYGIVSVLLSSLSHGESKELAKHPIDLWGLTHYEQHPSWLEAIEYLSAVAEKLFLLQNNRLQKTENETIVKIHNYIKSHLENDLSLTRLGEVTGYNPSYLSRFYSQTTGQNLTDYIAKERLLQAKELLAGSKLKISEIAERIGFASEHYFYRFFRKATNVSPQEYRECVKRGQSM